MKKKVYEMFDFVLFFCVIALIVLGILFIYSSGINSTGDLVTNEYIKQIVWASIGVVLMLLCAFVDYRKIEQYALYFYGALLLVLLYTRFFGRYVNGARSWLGIGSFGVQPSEFGKLFFTLMLARYLDMSRSDNQFKRFIVSGLIFALPTGLILFQPDMGTASVYIPIFFVMCFIAGIPIRYLLFLLGAGSVMCVFTILPVWNEFIAQSPIVAVTLISSVKARIFMIFVCAVITAICVIFKRYFHLSDSYYWLAFVFGIIAFGLLLSLAASKVLKEYQLKRLIVFMNPEVDPRGAGWNIIQSKIAVGAGGFFGKNFLNGSQSHLRFLPQQSTDFIFSILSEEFGFVGSFTVCVLYLILMLRVIFIIKNTSDRFGMYIASGFLGMFMIHFFVNIGMVIGIMPITGIPLMFLSYGGSSLLTAMISIGILMSIHSHKFYFS